MNKLSEEQAEALNKIWFIYGNGGRKSTLHNHKLIQGFIHYGEDRRETYIQGNKNMKERFDEEFYEKNKLTDECLEVVNLILEGRINEALKIAKRGK